MDGADLDVAEVGQVIEIMTDFYAEPRDNGTGMSYVSETFHAATKEKRKMKWRVEVSVTHMHREDRHKFIHAKAKEWTTWLDKEAVEIVKD